MRLVIALAVGIGLVGCFDPDGVVFKPSAAADAGGGSSGTGADAGTTLLSCATGNGGCDPLTTCSDTQTGRSCSACPTGYTGTGETGCVDVDECATGNGGCAQTCVNTAGGSHCDCGPGYSLELDGKSCLDADECATGNGGCAQTCVNEPGAFHCECGSGFTLNSDGAACDDVNECASGNGGCDPYSTCTNIDGGRTCGPCPSGFTGSGESFCLDVDECATDNGGCDARRLCSNTEGSRSCGPCGAGYTAVGATGCADLNECAAGNGGCAQSCVNEPGTFHCECGSGFALGTDNRSCVDVDECATDNGGCDPLSACANTPGGRSCGACPSGYSGSGETGCADIDECQTGNGGCDALLTCTNLAGGRNCGPGIPAKSCTAITTGANTVVDCADGTRVEVASGDPVSDPTLGALEVTLTSSKGGGAAGVNIMATPIDPVSDAGVVSYSTSTLTSGTSAFQLPPGVYDLAFSSVDYDSFVLKSVTIAAGSTAVVAATILRVNPLLIRAPVLLPQGFGNDVTCTFEVEGASPAAVYRWAQRKGPAVTLPASGTSLSFTTATAEQVINAVNAIYAPSRDPAPGDSTVEYDLRPNRIGLVGLTTQMLAEAAYLFELTVEEGGFTARASARVPFSPPILGVTDHPVGVAAVANNVREVEVTNAQGAVQRASLTRHTWTLTMRPSGSMAALHEFGSRNPWFVPDVAGTYTLTDDYEYVDPFSGATVSKTSLLEVQAGTYVGSLSTGGGAKACQTCHSSGGVGVTPSYENWSSSGHAQHFAKSIDGLTPNYRETCVVCHTTGYAKGVDNQGFDEFFEWPLTLQAGNFAALPDAARSRGAVGCESCHGPGSQHPMRQQILPMSAEVCGSCHDSGTNHDRFALWARSGHADRAKAQLDATVENRGTGTGNCARCHSAQGFVTYAANLTSDVPNGNPITLPLLSSPPGGALDPACVKGTFNASANNCVDLAQSRLMGLTLDTVEAVTCQACHKAHTLELRLTNDTGPLPSGFTATGVGAGALCMACHNTRNGARGDSVPLANAANATMFNAPHEPSQADVITGHNAFFVVERPSLHLGVTDTCVGCHVRTKPASVVPAPMTTNHTFRADTSICAGCHGPSGVDPNALEQEIQGKLSSVEAAIGPKAGSVLQATLEKLIDDGAGGLKPNSFSVRAWDQVLDLYSTNSGTGNVEITAPVTAASPVVVHGQLGLRVTLAHNVQFLLTDGTLLDTNVITFPLSSLKDNDPAVRPGSLGRPSAMNPFNHEGPNIVLVQAMWNYYLFRNDSSFGIHNPRFAREALDATKTQLDAWVPQALGPP